MEFSLARVRVCLRALYRMARRVALTPAPLRHASIRSIARASLPTVAMIVGRSMLRLYRRSQAHHADLDNSATGYLLPPFTPCTFAYNGDTAVGEASF